MNIPYINLNGNSPEDFIESTQTILELSRQLIREIAKADFDHARNARDMAHARQLQSLDFRDIAAIHKLMKRMENIQHDALTHIDNNTK